ncbi:unnamed protein product [Auanema sp. JU1783]|nr:unnamed protein product [Auanema sp. JU1783]
MCRRHLPKALHPSRVVSVPIGTKGVCESSVLHTAFVEGMKAYHVYEDNIKFCCLDQKWVCSEKNYYNKTSQLLLPLRKCATKEDCRDILGVCLSEYCCQPIPENLKCPYDQTPPTTTCSSDDDCAEGTTNQIGCFLPNNKMKTKFCCGTKPGILPLFTNDGGGHLWDKRCNEDAAYTTREDDHYVCCRTPFARNFYIQSAMVKPVININEKLPHHCSYPRYPCNADEYCGKAVYLSASSDATRHLNSTHRYCFKKPTCGGDVIYKDDEPVTCASSENCGEGEYCDVDMTHNGYTSKKGEVVTGICCKYTCPEITSDDESALVVSSNIPMTKYGVVKPRSDTGQICRFPPRYDGGRSKMALCCEYHMKVSVCPAEWNSQDLLVRSKTVSCEQHSDCNLRNSTTGVLCYKKEGYLFGVCCKLQLCDDGFTIPALEPECATPSDCGQKSLGSATCDPKLKRCCPRVSRGIIEHTYKTNTRCKVTTDCGYGLRYCEDNYCWLLGERDVRSVTKQTCFDQADCFGAFIMGVCVVERAGQVGQCYSHPFQTKFNNFKNVNPILKWFGIVCGLFSIIFGLISVIFYLKYRSRHFFESKKHSRYPDKRSSAPSKNQTETASFELESNSGSVECIQCVQVWRSASVKESRACGPHAPTCRGDACFMRQCKHCPVYQYMSGCVQLTPWQIADLEVNRRSTELRMRRVGAELLCEDSFNQTTCVCNRRDKCNSIHARLPYSTYSEGLFKGIINFDQVIGALDPRYLEVISGYHYRFPNNIGPIKFHISILLMCLFL